LGRTDAQLWKMKHLSTLRLLVVLRIATEVWADEPSAAPQEASLPVTTDEAPPSSETIEPVWEGKTPFEIEKMLIEEIKKPKGKAKGNKKGFNFKKTVGALLKKFKAQLLKDKKAHQKQLDDDVMRVRKCLRRKPGLLETESDKKKCPKVKVVKKCEKKIKILKRGKQKTCKSLEKVADKDVKTIYALVKEWNKKKVLKKDCKRDKGESVYHYVSRLSNHFGSKLKKFNVRLQAKTKAVAGKKKLYKKCNFIKHYARRLEMKTCTDIKTAYYTCNCGKYIKEQKICSGMKGCYTAAVRILKKNKPIIFKKNAAAKLEWRAVGRIECLLKVMGDKKGKADAKKLKKCVTGPQISTKPLKIWARGYPPYRCKMRGITLAVKKMCTKSKKPIIKKR